jgi:hypothetical protein
MQNKLLTKSNYLLGLQCQKLLWIAKNEKERIPEPDYSAKHNFKMGDIIGVLATKVFPKGVDLANMGFIENINATKEAVKKRQTIYEAGFMVDNLFSRGDVLVPVGEDDWDIFEVKSATKVKDVNIHDVSFQKHVYEKAGLKIRDCFLMHINNQYVKDGEIEPGELFVQTNINEKVEEFSKGIEKRIESMFKVIRAKKEKKSPIGIQCSEPYECALSEECWAGVPKGSIFDFYWMLKVKKFELWNSGITKLNEVPEDVELNGKQKIQRRLAFDGGKHINKLQIKNFLRKLKYPIYYLDFETIASAIPKFDGMKPYQRIPFQFSLHIQSKNGSLKHYSFLAEGTGDPRMEFMMELKRLLKKRGSIVVYNQGFEKGVMNEGAIVFPEFREWYDENILPRIKDLLDVFREFYYYDPKQKGSCSIKAVLPVMSDLSYEGMDIGEGMLASLEYERVTYDSLVSGEERLRVRDALEKYCELDTEAEVEIVKELKNIT